jgi:predicted negative regulator of RcsB-dependent stress response
MSKNNNDDTIVNVQEVYGKAESFFEKNRKSIYIGGGAIVAAIAGFLVYQFAIKGPKEAEAQNAIFKAIQYQEIDSASMALNGGPDFAGFEEIATKYSGTKAGMVASYWCGVNYRDMGEFEKAIEHFKNADFDDETIGIISMGNIGDCYVQVGNLEEAASWLDKAAKRAASSKSKNFTAPQYMLKAAKVNMELNKNDRAKSFLQDIKDNYDNKSAEWGEATRLLAMLTARES